MFSAIMVLMLVVMLLAFQTCSNHTTLATWR
jgi:hypothetical protein